MATESRERKNKGKGEQFLEKRRGVIMNRRYKFDVKLLTLEEREKIYSTNFVYKGLIIRRVLNFENLGFMRKDSVQFALIT